MNDGGPAFPQNSSSDVWEGISLRDYFAAKALQALATNGDPAVNTDAFCKLCYEIADAMLREREKHP